MKSLNNWIDSLSSNINNERDVKHWLKVCVTVILKILLSLIVIHLSWKCNHNSNIILRILYVLISLSFSEIYIFYYAFYRLYLGNTCPI